MEPGAAAERSAQTRTGPGGTRGDHAPGSRGRSAVEPPAPPEQGPGTRGAAAPDGRAEAKTPARGCFCAANGAVYRA